MISILNVLKFVLWPIMVYPLSVAHALKNAYFAALGWNVLFTFVSKSICSRLWFNCSVLFSCFRSGWFIHWWQWDIEVPAINILLLISPFKCVSICLIYYGAPMMSPFIFMTYIFLALCLSLWFLAWRLFSLMWVWLCLVSLLFPLVWNTLFHSFPLSLCVSLELMFAVGIV